jgi:hypothetical protein
MKFQNDPIVSMCRSRIISNGGQNKHHKATHKLLHKNTFTKPTMHGTERNRLYLGNFSTKKTAPI